MYTPAKHASIILNRYSVQIEPTREISPAAYNRKISEYTCARYLTVFERVCNIKSHFRMITKTKSLSTTNETTKSTS